MNAAENILLNYEEYFWIYIRWQIASRDDFVSVAKTCVSDFTARVSKTTEEGIQLFETNSWVLLYFWPMRELIATPNVKRWKNFHIMKKENLVMIGYNICFITPHERINYQKLFDKLKLYCQTFKKRINRNFFLNSTCNHSTFIHCVALTCTINFLFTKTSWSNSKPKTRH